MQSTAKDFTVLVAGTGFVADEGRKLTTFDRATVLIQGGIPYPITAGSTQIVVDGASIVHKLNRFSWGYKRGTIFAVVSLSPSAFQRDEDLREPRSIYLAHIDGLNLALLAALTDQGSDWHVGAAAVSKCGRIAEFEESYDIVSRSVHPPPDNPVRQPARVVGVHRVVWFKDRAANVIDAVRTTPGPYDFHDADPSIDHVHPPGTTALANDCHALINQTQMDAKRFLKAVNADQEHVVGSMLVCAFSPESLSTLQVADDTMLNDLVKSLGKTPWTDADHKRFELMHKNLFTDYEMPTRGEGDAVMAHSNVLYTNSTLFRQAFDARQADAKLDLGDYWPAATKLAARTCLVIIYLGALDMQTARTWVENSTADDVRDLLQMCVLLDDAEQDKRFVDIGRRCAKIHFWSDTARLNPQQLYDLWDWLRVHVGPMVEDLDILHVLVELRLYELHRRKLETEPAYAKLMDWDPTGRPIKRRRVIDITAALAALTIESFCE